MARVSLGFTEAEWKEFLASLTAQERAHFLQHADYAFSDATIRQEQGFAPLACYLRYETPQEMAERLAHETPKETARQPGLEDREEPGSNEIWFGA